MEWYTKGDGGSKRLCQRWPAYRHHCPCHRIPHQRDGLAEQKDLGFMPGLRQRVRMQKGEGRLGWIVRAPRALYQYFHVRLSTARKPSPAPSAEASSASGFVHLTFTADRPLGQPFLRKVFAHNRSVSRSPLQWRERIGKNGEIRSRQARPSSPPSRRRRARNAFQPAYHRQGRGQGIVRGGGQGMERENTRGEHEIMSQARLGDLDEDGWGLGNQARQDAGRGHHPTASALMMGRDH